MTNHPAPRARTVHELTKSAVHWAAADEAALLAGVLDGHVDAWREFQRRYDDTINKRLKYVVGQCWRANRSSDTFDEIKAEVYLALVDDDMRRLRAFNAERGNLVAWLSLIAQRIALNHIEKLMNRPRLDPIEALEEQEDFDPQRGARWLVEERAACDDLTEDAVPVLR